MQIQATEATIAFVLEPWEAQGILDKILRIESAPNGQEAVERFTDALVQFCEVEE